MRRLWLSAVLLLCFCAIAVGIVRGDLDADILRKATVICLECIGIG